MEASEHQSELGEWQTAQRPAHPRLRAHVHGYFASSSHLRISLQERHLPSTEVPLLLNFGAPHRRLNAVGAAEWTSRDGVWVVGLHNRHQLTTAVGERHFMVVRFTPIGAHLFLGLPMHLIANEALDLALVDPALARAIVSRVGVASSWTDRFAAMESLIAERVAEAEIPSCVGPALAQARGHRWPHRARFTRLRHGLQPPHPDCEIPDVRGISAEDDREAAALQSRRARARPTQRTRANEPASKPYIEGKQADDRRVGAIQWADLAADCGYFDQAHLIKDFREFAGSTPAAFLRHVSVAGLTGPAPIK